MNFKLFSIIILSVLMMSVASACYTRTVNGTVSDSSGNPVPGATVDLMCKTKLVNTSITNSLGFYSIKGHNDICPDGRKAFVMAYVSATDYATANKTMADPGITINLILPNYQTNQVPEFSTITALAALIGSGAGFLVLRRKA